MAELMKARINADSLGELARRIKKNHPAFESEAFVSEILDADWDSLELKARIRKTALALGKTLPADYSQAVTILRQTAADYPAGSDGLMLMCLPDYVELFGQAEADWEASMAALEQITSLASAEFAVRAFILRDEKRMMAQMAVWAEHKSEHVRRLASEGCRPQLPWGQALASFKQDPAPVLRILELLKADPSPYVQKSVANNLNDISKTHPELVLETARRWQGQNPVTDWILKHGCRTLLKKGNPEALALFGVAENDHVKTTEFMVMTPVVRIGEELVFSFAVAAENEAQVRLEYAVDYVKAKGKRSRKNYKISELTLKAGEKRTYVRKQRFADTSVRKHYPGRHAVTLIAVSYTHLRAHETGRNIVCRLLLEKKKKLKKKKLNK